MESLAPQPPADSVTCVPQHLLRDEPALPPREKGRLWEELLELYDLPDGE